MAALRSARTIITMEEANLSTMGQVVAGHGPIKTHDLTVEGISTAPVMGMAQAAMAHAKDRVHGIRTMLPRQAGSNLHLPGCRALEWACLPLPLQPM